MLKNLRNYNFLVHTLLDSEVLKGIEPSRVILGGISQGGVLALTAAYSYHSNFAGILALSTWIPYTLQSQLVEVNLTGLHIFNQICPNMQPCLLYTSDAADE